MKIFLLIDKLFVVLNLQLYQSVSIYQAIYLNFLLNVFHTLAVQLFCKQGLNICANFCTSEIEAHDCAWNNWVLILHKKRKVGVQC